MKCFWRKNSDNCCSNRLGKRNKTMMWRRINLSNYWGILVQSINCMRVPRSSLLSSNKSNNWWRDTYLWYSMLDIYRKNLLLPLEKMLEKNNQRSCLQVLTKIRSKEKHLNLVTRVKEETKISSNSTEQKPSSEIWSIWWDGSNK